MSTRQILDYIRTKKNKESAKLISIWLLELIAERMKERKN